MTYFGVTGSDITNVRLEKGNFRREQKSKITNVRLEKGNFRREQKSKITNVRL